MYNKEAELKAKEEMLNQREKMLNEQMMTVMSKFASMPGAENTATVELAAIAVGCEPKQIAKTMSFDVNGKTILVLLAGDAKVDNSKYKQTFGAKAKMLSFDEVETRVGHRVGGVCPFGIKENIDVYLDSSLKSAAG